MSDGNAQYVVDIAAQMTGGVQTTGQLDAVTQKLMGAGASSDDLRNAIAKLSNSLDAAKSASAAATAALALGETEYSRLEKAALQAAKAEEKAALAGVVPPEVHQSAVAAASAVDAYTKTLKGLETEVDATKAAEKSLNTTLSNAKQLHIDTGEAAEEHSLRAQGLGRALGQLGGPLGDLGRTVVTPIAGFQKLGDQLGTSTALAAASAIGVVALAAAVIALSAALVVGTLKIAAWAVGLADTRREAGLATEAFEIMNPKVEALHATIDSLGNQTGLTEASLDGIAKSLIDAKVSAKDLPAALQAAALAERALGSGGANQFLADMKASSKSVKQFSADTTAQLGGVVAKQMLGLDAQTATLKSNIGKIFGDLNIDPVLSGVQKLVGLFDENSESAQALKFLFTSVFQPLIDQADDAATVIEAFAIGFEIGLVKLYIALKPTIKAIAEFFGEHDPSLTDMLADATKAGEEIAPVIAAIAIGFTAAIAAVGLFVGALIAVQIGIYAAIAAVIDFGITVVQDIIGAWNSVTDYLTSIDLGTIGNALIQGLIAGIEGAAGSLVSSITGVVGGGIDAAKHLLGIHSPSTVFAGIGDNTMMGYVQGIDGAANDTQAAVSDAIAPPDIASPLAQQDNNAARGSGNTPPAGSSGNTSSSPKAAGSSMNFNGAVFNFNGVKDAAQAKDMFEEAMTKLLEGDALQASGAEDTSAAA